MRETSLCELRVCLQAQGEIGFPPSVGADAALGFSRMADRGAVITMTMRDAGKFALARLEGSATNAQNASESGAGRRAEEGYGPCCTRARHVAASPMYQLGKYSRLKGAGRPCGWLADCGPRGDWPPANMRGTLEDCRRIGTGRPSCQMRPFRILWLARLFPMPPRKRIVLSRLRNLGPIQLCPTRARRAKRSHLRRLNRRIPHFWLPR